MASKKPVKKKVVKKSSAKPSSLFAKYWQNYRTMIILAALAVIFIGYWIIAQELPKRAEKRDLIQKHQKLEELSRQSVGKENFSRFDSRKYCFEKSGFKFEKKGISCTVEVSYIFKNVDINEANRLKNSFAGTIPAKIKESGYPNSPLTDFTVDILTKQEHLSFYSFLPRDLNKCTVSYLYNTNNELVVRFTCANLSPKSQHFEMEKIT